MAIVQVVQLRASSKLSAPKDFRSSQHFLAAHIPHQMFSPAAWEHLVRVADSAPVPLQVSAGHLALHAAHFPLVGFVHPPTSPISRKHTGCESAISKQRQTLALFEPEQRAVSLAPFSHAQCWIPSTLSHPPPSEFQRYVHIDIHIDRNDFPPYSQGQSEAAQQCNVSERRTICTNRNCLSPECSLCYS